MLLNINVPDVPFTELCGFEYTRLGYRKPAKDPKQTANPRGQSFYWVSAANSPEDQAEGTDFHAIANNKVSITRFIQI